MGRGFRAVAWLALLGAAGCPVVGEERYDAEVRDADGDGFVGQRFDGPDCDDGNPAIHPDAADTPYDGVDSDCDALDDFDADLDGFPLDADCDDTRRDVHPDAEEQCDGFDNDCDLLIDDLDVVDDAFLTTFFPDLDDDGFGADTPVRACVAPARHIDRGGDCDDADSTIHPDAVEVCDGFDHDCDGDIHAGAFDATAWYPDLDGDGFGDDAAQAVVACDAPAEHVADRTDCDDAAPLARPGAQGLLEICDGFDNDCDGQADDADPQVLPASRTAWFADDDGDAFGGGPPVFACAAPAGHLALGTDCDDVQPLVNPAMAEACNNQDDDCNGLVDDGAFNPTLTLFTDGDGDGFGVNPVLACAASPGVATADGDCDDADPRVRPGAPEICGDDVRQDCSGADVEDCDGDGDLDAIDCQPSDPEISTSAIEICDGIDNDCDERIDAADTITPVATDYFLDLDGDGWGSAVPAIAVQVCVPPPNAVARQGDCDDTDASRFPGNPESCDGADNDCNGQVDDGQPADPPTFYRDVDRDGFGLQAEPYALACAPPGALWAGIAGDCDDTRDVIFPGADEICDQRDNDCDLLLDAADPDVLLAAWFRDDDGDGAGSPSQTQLSCEQPSGFVGNSADCNDTDPTVIGSGTYYRDVDADGFGDPTVTLDTCSPPVGYVPNGIDCDDALTQVNPGQLEVCDGVDNDCDDQIDDDDPGLTGGVPLYVDEDGDGFGVGTPESRCDPVGFAYLAGDCDDTSSGVRPGALEDCKTPADDDCSGVNTNGVEFAYADGDGDGLGGALGLYVCGTNTTPLGGDCDDADALVQGPALLYRDVDDDGFGAGSLLAVCPQPGFVTTDTDCDDLDAATRPGALDSCDGIDRNCDGADGPMFTGYLDTDGDGYGVGNGPGSQIVRECGPLLPDFAAVGEDCDDGDATRYPTAPEFCDNVDRNCDGNDQQGPGPTAWIDGDGDGWGSTTYQAACGAPGLVLRGGDCADADINVHPGVVEACDGFDDNCSGDESDGRELAWLDGDGDLLGDPSTAFLRVCDASLGVLNADDCDDALFGPATLTWYRDADGDGQGTPSDFVDGCTAPPGFVSGAGDCDDDDFSVVFAYDDLDGDGLGDANARQPTCPGNLTGYVFESGDCWDTAEVDLREAAAQVLSPTATVFVLPGGPISIAQAIERACDGGEVLVAPGTYRADATITLADKALHVRAASEGGDDTRIDFRDATTSGLVLQHARAGTLFEGISIRGGPSAGLVVDAGSRAVWAGGFIGDFGLTGIKVLGGSELTVFGTEIEKNGTLLTGPLFEGGGVTVIDGTLTMHFAKLVENTGGAPNATAAWVRQDGELILDGTRIEYHYATPNTVVVEGLLTATDTRFVDNRPGGTQAVVAIQNSGAVDLHDTLFVENLGRVFSGLGFLDMDHVTIGHVGGASWVQASSLIGVMTRSVVIASGGANAPDLTVDATNVFGAASYGLGSTNVGNPLWRYDVGCTDLSVDGFDALRNVSSALPLDRAGAFLDPEDPWNQDLDNDTLPDGWEQRFGGGDLSLYDATTNSDDDALDAANELRVGTDPNFDNTDGEGQNDNAGDTCQWQ